MFHTVVIVSLLAGQCDSAVLAGAHWGTDHVIVNGQSYAYDRKLAVAPTGTVLGIEKGTAFLGGASKEVCTVTFETKTK